MEIRFISSKQVRAPADAELPLPVVRAPDLSGRVLGARYSLRRRIGGGSMGTVYEARDMTLGTAVAVKVLHPDYSGDEDFRRRFHQEALLGARLRHEHSVAVTDLGQSDDGLLYSVMEYLEGESLDGLLSSRPGPLPWRRVVTIAVQVCAALQAAHDRGVIHRDIKPGNCFLVRREGHPTVGADDDGPPFTFVKVLDLGLARLMPSGGRPTPPGRLGAPEYLAPEQIQGFTCDHRVDIYALGVMMYKLLTRRLPFTGDGPAAIMRMHIETPPTPLRRLAPNADIPASLEAVVLRALAKDRADRYASAHTMAQAIRAAAADAEAEAIAIDEAPDDTPIRPSAGRWRAAASTRGTPVSATMILVPAFGNGLHLRSGLLGLLLALTSILVAIAWASERAPVIAAPSIAAPTSHVAAPAAITTPKPDRTGEPTLDLAGPLGPGLVQPAAWIDNSVLVNTGELGNTISGDLGNSGDFANSGDFVDASYFVDAGAPRTVTVQPPRARATRAATPNRGAVPDRPPAPALAPLLPGAPTKREFSHHVDMVAPGVYRCMRQHCPERQSLTIELTVGGPRRTPVALGLPDHDTPALRKCLAPLLVRLSFTPTERTARYSHVYRR